VNVQEIYNHWRNVRAGLFEALDKLSDAQLDFKAGEGLWSLKETACHIAGAEEGWFRYIVTHEIKGWEEADFKATDYPTVVSIKRLLSEVHERTESFLFPAGDSIQSQSVQLPWGSQTTVGWVVWHVLEHEIHHRGEIYLMLGLMGIEAPDV
jgi:uncharacterized damage-inducible protein DinB